MILHIPHARIFNPDNMMGNHLFDNIDYDEELRLMTDLYTDSLFDHPGARKIIFKYSRLMVDVERFPDDADEPMAAKGMGRFHTHTHDGRPLRKPHTPEDIERLSRIYDEHHDALTHAVQQELREAGSALIIDCHSFPSAPLPCDLDQSVPRPDICIGTDPIHTPGELTTRAVQYFEEQGFNVEVNRPFAGSLVPSRFYQKDPRVHSIMIELNRCTYLGTESVPGRREMKEIISRFLEDLSQRHTAVQDLTDLKKNNPSKEKAEPIIDSKSLMETIMKAGDKALRKTNEEAAKEKMRSSSRPEIG